MRILGVGYYVAHDSSVAMMSDDGLEFAVSEERLSRRKRDGSRPTFGLRCLSDATFDVTVCPYNSALQYQSEFDQSPIHEITNRMAGVQRRHEAALRGMGVTEFLGHHFSHAAGAFFTSGFEDAVVITYDGGICCEPWCSTVWYGSPSGLRNIRKTTFLGGASAAVQYSAITSLLGFRPIHDEGKVTGLAAWGNPSTNIMAILHEAFRKSRPISAYYDGRFAREYSWLKECFSLVDIAASVQVMAENAVETLIQECGLTPSQHNCVLAGGLFSNVRLNLCVQTMGFRNVYVYPAMGDEGLAVGAIAGWAIQNGLKAHPLVDLSLGPTYDSEDILLSLESSGLRYKRVEDIDRTMATLLAEERIVARFSGRCEFGPRALGNRSILYQASDPRRNDWLNQKLGRTETMPFAPVTCMERADKLFFGLQGIERCTCFMTMAVHCTPHMKNVSPATVHVDGTARPQIVSRRQNRSLHRLLEEYYSLTGLPTLINTSFNVHGEPIVCSPSDAIACFVRAELDYLAIGEFIATR